MSSVGCASFSIKANECSLCGEAFETKKGLTAHLAEKHDITKPFECSICKGGFVNQYSLDIHISRVHEKVKPHLCSLCGKSFPSTSTLKKHIDAVHEKKEYECEECNEIFKNVKSNSCSFYSFHILFLFLDIERYTKLKL